MGLGSNTPATVDKIGIPTTILPLADRNIPMPTNDKLATAVIVIGNMFLTRWISRSCCGIGCWFCSSGWFCCCIF